MFFPLLHAYARLVMQLYFRKIKINKPEYLRMKGPLLIAANHPNSFLDGMLLTALFEQPVYSLARGDAFANKAANRILRALRLLPVYRTSEGPENLVRNYQTFAACRKTFEKNGIVLIFSEAASINEWRLRPLRKGTARLAITSWEKGMDLKVLPLGFNYSSFRSFGKNMVLNFGTPIRKETIMKEDTDGRQLVQFNELLQSQLQDLVFEIDPADKNRLEEKLGVFVPRWQKFLLFVPSLAGWILHAPLYYSIRMITRIFFNNDHYDSVQAALLMLLYPLYLFMVACIAALWMKAWMVVLLLICMPFTARAFLLLKKQFPGHKKSEPSGSPVSFTR